MLSKVFTGSLYGLESQVVTVETDLTPGLPALALVGLPDMSVRESKERIRSAILNSGEKFPQKRITINLSPASGKKEGTHFDLPMAIGILAAYGAVKSDRLQSFAFMGELSLDGKVNRIKGALPLVMGMRECGIVDIMIPISNLEEVRIVTGINLYPINSLKDAIQYLRNSSISGPYHKGGRKQELIKIVKEDFSDVAGQETVKRAIQIGASGCHGLLMIGPAGSGKTMVAKRIPTILPPMTYEEQLEVTKIYSVAGALSEEVPIISVRPFRSPHHTITTSALIGGGRRPTPGEVSLAHYGVLFLDELPEFKRQTIEMLRQPIEDEKVTICRVVGTTSFPSKIMVVAAMNPCPCGYYGDETHECTCSSHQINQYLSKLSGPILDRLDMHIQIMPVKYKELVDCSSGQNQRGETSAEMRKSVEKAREIQLSRYRNETITYNSQLTTPLIKKYCTLDKGTNDLLGEAFHKLALSARAYMKIIKLSRTIADMQGVEKIRMEHVAEAIQYRSLDRVNRG